MYGQEEYIEKVNPEIVIKRLKEILLQLEKEELSYGVFLANTYAHLIAASKAGYTLERLVEIAELMMTVKPPIQTKGTEDE